MNDGEIPKWLCDEAQAAVKELFGELGNWRCYWQRRGDDIYYNWQIGLVKAFARKSLDNVFEIVGTGPTLQAAYDDCHRQLLRKR